MLHYAYNKPVGVAWGEPDLAPMLPWIGRYSAWLEDRARLNRFRQAFVFILRGKFPDKAAQLARQRELNSNPPPPGSILVTDESESWGVLSPELSSFEAGEDGLALKKMIAVGAGVPTHFLAEPESSHPHHGRSSRNAHVPWAGADPAVLPGHPDGDRQAGSRASQAVRPPGQSGFERSRPWAPTLPSGIIPISPWQSRVSIPPCPRSSIARASTRKSCYAWFIAWPGRSIRRNVIPTMLRRPLKPVTPGQAATGKPGQPAGGKKPQDPGESDPAAEPDQIHSVTRSQWRTICQMNSF